MAKSYLYILFSVFIFLNVIESLNTNVREGLERYSEELLKIEKQKLYKLQKKDVIEMLEHQEKKIIENKTFFFNPEMKETLIFSKIQSYIQSSVKQIGGKIIHLNTGTVVKKNGYRKYLISLEVKCIPEDLNKLFKKFNEWEKYLFIDAIYIVTVPSIRGLKVELTLIGYQIK